MSTDAPVGIIGFGDLGRTLHNLIAPFRNPVAVYDPWLPDELICARGAAPMSLDGLLRSSRGAFIFASATTENQGVIGKREFELLQPGSAFLLMSRAAKPSRTAATASIGGCARVFVAQPAEIG